MKYGCSVRVFDDKYNYVYFTYYSYCCYSKFDQFGRNKYKDTGVEPIWQIEEIWVWDNEFFKYEKKRVIDRLLDVDEARLVKRKYFKELEMSYD